MPMSISQRVKNSGRPALVMTLLIWIIFLFEWVLGATWSYLGVLPRHIDGLWEPFFSGPASPTERPGTASERSGNDTVPVTPAGPVVVTGIRSPSRWTGVP